MKPKMKYGAIVPLGCACLAAQSLRETGRREEAFPLDWVVPIDLAKGLELVENHFQNFFDKEDFVHVPERDSQKNFAYWNKRTNILFLHDFRDDRAFAGEYERIKEKYNRRIKRLYRILSKKNNVLFLYVHSSYYLKHKPTDDEIKTAFNRLTALYPHKNLHLLYISLSGAGAGFAVRHLTDKIDYVDCFESPEYKEPDSFGDYYKYRENVHRLYDEYLPRPAVASGNCVRGLINRLSAWFCRRG